MLALRWALRAAIITTKTFLFAGALRLVLMQLTLRTPVQRPGTTASRT
jgi:hypothetical protein